ncbi:hypothetical protein Pd630_LPD04457 [Rhodococcus opacus PD630]|nr:hypothetical protein Pd630_LPD04457 [Rhodococcus opacus PD630]
MPVRASVATTIQLRDDDSDAEMSKGGLTELLVAMVNMCLLIE